MDLSMVTKVELEREYDSIAHNFVSYLKIDGTTISYYTDKDKAKSALVKLVYKVNRSKELARVQGSPLEQLINKKRRRCDGRRNRSCLCRGSGRRG